MFLPIINNQLASSMSPTPSGFPPDAFDPSVLPDVDNEFIDEEDIKEFAKAFHAPDCSPFVSLNDWVKPYRKEYTPIYQRVRRKGGTRGRKKKKHLRGRDETREGLVYSILRGPLLVTILFWITSLGALYWLTRLYVWAYERLVRAWHTAGPTKEIRSKTNFEDWRNAAKALDRHLGNELWKETDDYAYYDFMTVMKAKRELRAGLNEAMKGDK